MFPHAPQLFTPRGMVTDDPAGVTYWKVDRWNPAQRHAQLPRRAHGRPDVASDRASQPRRQVPPEALEALQPALVILPVQKAAGATKPK